MLKYYIAGVDQGACREKTILKVNILVEWIISSLRAFIFSTFFYFQIPKLSSQFDLFQKTKITLKSILIGCFRFCLGLKDSVLQGSFQQKPVQFQRGNC
jgi:phosphate/sulfate permease